MKRRRKYYMGEGGGFPQVRALVSFVSLRWPVACPCRNPSLGLVTKAKGLQGCGSKGSPGAKAKRPQGCGPKGSPGVTSHTPRNVRKCEGVWGSVREWTLTLPRQLSLWEIESRWTPETSESDFRGQNSMACGIFYIIRKLLERRCLKWARITHLESETQVMAKRRAGSQTDNLTPDH
jgi:hypothetical protein